jgi:hypothetical protein
MSDHTAREPAHKENESVELVLHSEKYEVVLTENGKEEIYSMERQPDASSILVLQSKQEILHEMSLEAVLTNLERSGDLLFVAYNGVAGVQGGKLQAKLSGLQKTLADLCNDCVLAMQLFRTESGEVLGYLIATFKWLVKGKESVAVKQLVRCEGSAKKMADESEKLAKRFDEIATTTESVLEQTQEAQGAANEKKLESEQKLRDLAANQKKMTELQKGIAEDLKEMQELYNDAKERAETESKRAFILGITSALTSAIGAGIGAYAATQNPIPAVTSAVTKAAKGDGPKPDTEKEQKEIAAKKKEADAATQKAKADEKKATEAEKEADAAKKEADAAKGAAEKAAKEAAKASDEKAKEVADAKQKEADAKQKEAQTKEEKASAARENAAKSKAIAEGLAASLKELASRLTTMQEAAQKAADSIRDEKTTYLNKKLDLQKQSREALASLAEYAERMKNTTIEKGVAESAVQSLQLAIRALKQIVTSLLNASLFWRSMEQFCKKLSESKLREQIKDIEDLELEERLAYYRDIDFVTTAVYYIARWKALEVICTEYLAAANAARKKVLANIEAAPTIEESQRLAPILADTLLEHAKQDMARLDERTAQIEAQKKAVASPA